MMIARMTTLYVGVAMRFAAPLKNSHAKNSHAATKLLLRL
jgi:hypothetical protein